AAYQGSFGQTKGVNWAKFAGVLNEPEFHEVHDHIGGMRKAGRGRARMATSLARTKAGYKHKGGNTAQDEFNQQQQDELRKQSELIAEQQKEIDELKAPKVEDPGGELPPSSAEASGEGDVVEPDVTPEGW
ncbi:MAG: hypothetical protein ACXABY_08880, partial [Candidatus Thorarchaeota archaeon]